MKILQINAVYDTKSTGRSCKEFRDWAIHNGHDCLTLYGNSPVAKVNETEAMYFGSYLTHKIHAVTGRFFGDSGIGSWLATKKMLNIINAYKPDIVNLRNLHGNYINIPILLDYLSKKNIPTVVQTDDCFWFTGGCMHYTVNKCFEWQRDCKKCHYLRRGREFLIANEADKALTRKKKLFHAIPRLAVLGVSGWTAQQARLSSVFRDAPIIDYVYNWIDLSIFCPQGRELDSSTRTKLGLQPTDTMVLGVASGWGAKKGLDRFIELRHYLPEDTKIYLVGNMDSNVCLPDGIIALGSTESTESLACLYSAADVFVHLSLEETFGKVTAEALACGTPAVVYDSTASPELVSPETGVCVQPGDIINVANAIRQLADKHPAEACRARAEHLFDLDTNCNRMIEIYQQTIDLL